MVAPLPAGLHAVCFVCANENQPLLRGWVGIYPRIPACSQPRCHVALTHHRPIPLPLPGPLPPAPQASLRRKYGRRTAALLTRAVTFAQRFRSVKAQIKHTGSTVRQQLAQLPLRALTGRCA